jgi:hypothetical protein
MPVDKFGRSTSASSEGGFSLSEANASFLRRDGTNTATADIDLSLHKLINVADPINTKDAVNKDYADAKVSKTGDTMTGDLTFTTGTDQESRLYNQSARSKLQSVAWNL